MDKKKPDDKKQSERFLKKAKEISDDDAEEKFERALKNIVPPKPHSKSRPENGKSD